MAETTTPAGGSARRLLPLLAAGITVLLWASAFIGIRYAGRELSPGALSLGRLAIGSVILGILALTRERVWPTKLDCIRLLVCGVAWFGIYNVALNEAERHVSAGIAAMLVNIGPILIATLAGFLLAEGFPRGLFAGGLLAFSGVAVIAAPSSASAQADLFGVALCMVAACSYAVGVVSQKPLVGHLPALTVTWLACGIGMIVCLPFAPALVTELSTASSGTVAAVVYLGAFPTAVAFTTWAYALKQTTAGKMGATTYLVPPLAILLGWAFLGEQPPPLALGGGALCLAGVYISRRLGQPFPAGRAAEGDSP